MLRPLAPSPEDWPCATDAALKPMATVCSRVVDLMKGIMPKIEDHQMLKEQFEKSHDLSALSQRINFPLLIQ